MYVVPLFTQICWPEDPRLLYVYVVDPTVTTVPEALLSRPLPLVKVTWYCLLKLAVTVAEALGTV